MGGVDRETIIAVKGIDVPTLRAIQDTGIDAAQIKAAQGVDISRLQAIGDSTKELDAASIREATEMKKMVGDLSQVKEFLGVLQPPGCFMQIQKIEEECVEMLKRAPWNTVPTDKIKFILQCALDIETGTIPKSKLPPFHQISSPKPFLEALRDISKKDFIYMMENADFAVNIRRQVMDDNVAFPCVEEVSMDDLYSLQCVRENNTRRLKQILAKCEDGELEYYNKKLRSYQDRTDQYCVPYHTQRKYLNR